MTAKNDKPTARDLKLLEAIRSHPERYPLNNERFRDSPGIKRLLAAKLLKVRAFPIVIAACYSPNDADGAKYHKETWNHKPRKSTNG